MVEEVVVRGVVVTEACDVTSIGTADVNDDGGGCGSCVAPPGAFILVGVVL